MDSNEPRAGSGLCVLKLFVSLLGRLNLPQTGGAANWPFLIPVVLCSILRRKSLDFPNILRVIIIMRFNLLSNNGDYSFYTVVVEDKHFDPYPSMGNEIKWRSLQRN